MKTVLSKPYFLIPLRLLVNGALLIGGLSLLAKVFAPELSAEVVEPEQVPTQVVAEVAPPQTATTPEPPVVTLQDALPVGYKAATLAQTAKTKEEWNAVAKQWLAAIEILEDVPETSPDYSTAKAKRNEYLKNIEIALKNIEIANAKAEAASGDSAQPPALSTTTGPSPHDTTSIAKGDAIAGYRVTSAYGPRVAPCHGCSSYHPAIDVATPTGTPIHAPAAVEVICKGDPRSGNYAQFELQGITHQLLHLSKCTPGKANPGDTIGATGATGAGTGAHLDIRVKQDGQSVLPSKAVITAILDPSTGTSRRAPGTR